MKRHNYRKCKTCEYIRVSEHGINTDVNRVNQQYDRHINCAMCETMSILAHSHYAEIKKEEGRQ